MKAFNFLKFLRYQFYHRLAYFYIFLFAKDKITYSQNKEDLIIDILTDFKSNGIYIDVGANHPDECGNNTKKFYERGWHGINIEPDLRGYEEFLKRRPRDINLNVGIGEGEVDYFECSDSTGSTCLKEVVEKRNYSPDCYTVRKIRLVPLRQIFQENNLTFVDFINIDVEGFENEVLRSNDWDKYRAKVLCMEGRGYDEFLKQFSYKKVLFDGSNTFYKLKKN